MISISDAIVMTYQLYQAGNLSQAEALCQQILQQQPDSTEALHMLGTIAHQLGRLNEAITYYKQLIALVPDYAEIYYHLGAALHASGQLTDAIASYQQAIALKPNYTDVHYDLGHAFKEQGNIDTAIEHYQQAIALNPNDAEAYCNLANTLLEQSQTEKAIAHYQQALTLRPNVPGVYYNLGNAFRQQDQLEDAITHFRWAIALDPNYGDAYLKLAESLHSSGKLTEAIFYYQQAIFHQPNSTEAYCNWGTALSDQGKYEDAIIQYQQALAIDSQTLNVYIKLGCTLISKLQYEDAINCFQQALTIHPDYPDAYYNLGVAFVNRGQPDEAILYFQKVLQLQPDFIQAYWQRLLVLPILYETQEQILIWRQRFCQGLQQFIQHVDLHNPSHRKQSLKLLQKNALTFYLNYQGLNDLDVQQQYGNFVHQVVAANYPQWINPLPMPPLSSEGKIRIGYLSSHFRGHTVAKLFLGWLKYCNKDKFEVYCYHMGAPTDAITQQFQACSDRFHHIYSNGNLEAVCQQIVTDNLHILVFPDIGMEPQTTLIAGLRLAPVQCMAWGHPVTSGLPTIDYFLSSELMEPEKPQTHYSEKLVPLPNISLCYEKPTIPKATKSRLDFNLREDAVVYLSCQSLFKYLPQFDYIFAAIAQQVPQAQFAFIASPTSAITEKFQARLQRAFANFGLNSEDYCVFVPKQDWISYLNLNLVSDIFLDTFSWSGGNTTLEAIACGLPVVTCPGEFMRGRHAYGILTMMGITETIAQNESEYIEIAVHLGLDTNWRQDIVQKVYESHRWLYEDKTCVAALEEFYEKVVTVQR